MLQQLGESIASYAENVTGGVLVFFPSYRFLNDANNLWRNKGIIDIMKARKTVYLETSDQADFKKTIRSFEKDIDEGLEPQSGSILMGVCRGRLSEGLDFKDRRGRCVIIVGIPYPSLMEPKILLKRYYLDRRREILGAKSLNENGKEVHHLNSANWYDLQAFRAINQATGRVIRHARDFGAIILMDSRFQTPKNQNQISSWLQDQIIVPETFEQSLIQTKTFFDKMRPRSVNLWPLELESRIGQHKYSQSQIANSGSSSAVLNAAATRLTKGIKRSYTDMMQTQNESANGEPDKS